MKRRLLVAFGALILVPMVWLFLGPRHWWSRQVDGESETSIAARVDAARVLPSRVAAVLGIGDDRVDEDFAGANRL